VTLNRQLQLLECCIVLQELRTLWFAGKDCCPLPATFFCGDFNAAPEDAALFDLLRTGMPLPLLPLLYE
jgi:hypothetical protein